MTKWSACRFLNDSNRSAGHPSAREQPASRSGRTTVLSGFRIFAVSAMKCTPAKTMTSAFVFLASCASWSEVARMADEIGDVLDVGLLVVVREHDGVLDLLEARDLVEEVQRRIERRGHRRHRT